MRFEHLRSFIAVADEYNFTKAAERLYMTQPNLTKQVKALEKELGCQLFQRNPRDIKLTPEGEALLPFARESLYMIDEGIVAMREIGRRRSQLLTIGAILSNYSTIVPTLVANFAKTHPEFRIEFAEVEMEEAIAAVCKGELSGAFVGTWAPRDFPEPLMHIPVKTIGEKALVGCDHPWARRSSITKEDLEGSALLFARGRTGRQQSSPVVQDVADAGISVSTRFVDFEGSLLRMVELGQGVAFIPDSCVIEGYDLVEVPYVSDRRIHCSFVWNSRDASEPVARFAEFLRAAG